MAGIRISCDTDHQYVPINKVKKNQTEKRFKKVSMGHLYLKNDVVSSINRSYKLKTKLLEKLK